MPRIARGLADNFVYHILNRGNNKQIIFQKKQDYMAFINLMLKAKRRWPVKILAYCLMPNHFHMMITPIRAEYLSKWMQWLMTSHVRSYHEHYGTSGHVWQGRFKSFIIQRDEHLITVMRYIDANPVRSRLVASAGDWLWSSHREMLGKSNRNLIDSAPVELPKDWESCVNDVIKKEELDGIRQSIRRQSPYGSVEWRLTVCKDLGLEHTIRPRGRPKLQLEVIEK